MGLMTQGYKEVIKVEHHVHAHTTELREILFKLGAWPEAADDFIELMPYSRLPRLNMTERDKEWLPQVIEATLNKEDIGARFPAIFQKLLLNIEFCEQFLLQLRLKLRQV